MSTTMSADLESGCGRRQRRWRRRQRRRHRHFVAGKGETTMDGSLCFSDFDYDDRSWRSSLGSTAGGSLDECGLSEIEGVLGWQQKVFSGDEESEAAIELGCS
ncbi:hypothetical protein U1Q18_033468, partial [Sarracenia purpurea var. burkii]